MRTNNFSHAVTEALGYYVYCLRDPRTKEVFYIGKGVGNRIFAHLNESLTEDWETAKLDQIRDIHKDGLEVEHVIHRHGLTEDQAFEVEAALIDFAGRSGLTNLVSGHYSRLRGPMSIDEVMIAYDAPLLTVTERCILVIINKQYERTLTADALYEATRGNWVIGQKREKAQYAFAVAHGIVREVYEIQSWEPAVSRFEGDLTEGRWRFIGQVATELGHYKNGSVRLQLGTSAQNP